MNPRLQSGSLLVLLPVGRTAPLAHDPPTSARCGLCRPPGRMRTRGATADRCPLHSGAGRRLTRDGVVASVIAPDCSAVCERCWSRECARPGLSRPLADLGYEVIVAAKSAAESVGWVVVMRCPQVGCRARQAAPRSPRPGRRQAPVGCRDRREPHRVAFGSTPLLLS